MFFSYFEKKFLKTSPTNSLINTCFDWLLARRILMSRSWIRRKSKGMLLMPRILVEYRLYCVRSVCNRSIRLFVTSENRIIKNVGYLNRSSVVDKTGDRMTRWFQNNVRVSMHDKTEDGWGYKNYTFYLKQIMDGFGGLVVSILASGTRVRGFKPGRSRWIFRGSGKSSVWLPSEGK